MTPNYKKCCFIKSATLLKDCPEAIAEVAFVGRSNAGKSSAINYLTSEKIAKTSKTPGRTQLINFFQIGDQQFLVDLPGYGYAKVPLAEKQKWQRFLNVYINKREALIGLVLVMDCRHPMRDMDKVMLNFCQQAQLPAHIILTKADKLSKNEQKSTYYDVAQELAQHWPLMTVQLFSASKKYGEQDLVTQLDTWFMAAMQRHQEKNPAVDSEAVTADAELREQLQDLLDD